MIKFYIACMLVVMSMTLSAQTLFEDTLSTAPIEQSDSNSPLSRTQSRTVNAKKMVDAESSPSSTPIRYIGTNLESVIMRGDIQLTYEMVQQGRWSTLLHAHFNPQERTKSQTGSMGVMGGGRMYLARSGWIPDIYLQGLVGFNQYSNWDLIIALELGHRMPWTPNIFLDLGMTVYRSYTKTLPDPMIYFTANISFALNQRLLPFL